MSSMVTRKTPSARRWRNTSGFTGVLTSAVLEWLLIFLLFVNALFSYLVTRLARFCELQTPCLLCSRLDHLFGNERPGFYLDLICGQHKLEISSLVFCHVHSRLADVYGMCESCLFSFATQKKSNSETYRLLVGALGADFECCDKQETVLGCSSQKICSCCKKSWTSRLETHKVVEVKSAEHEVAELDIPSSTSVEKSPSEVHDDVEYVEKISRDVEFSSVQPEAAKLDVPSPTSVEKNHLLGNEALEFSENISREVEEPEVAKPDIPSPASVTQNLLPVHDDLEDTEKISREEGSSSLEANAFDPLSHIGYSQINVTSDTESEVQFSDADDKSSLVRRQNELHGEIKSAPHVPQNAQPLPMTLSGDLVPEVSIHHGSVAERTLLIPQPQHVDESLDFTSPADGVVDENGLQGISSHQAKEETDAAPPELISLHDVPSSPIAREVIVEELAESSNDTVPDVLQPPPATTGIQELYKLETGSMKSVTRTNLVLNDSGPSMTTLMDLSDAYKLVIDNKGNEAFSSTEQATVKDSPRVSGDLKLWLSQISSARGPEFSLSEISPRVYGQWDDPKMYDAPSPIGLQILQQRISLERNMSGFESLDGSIVSEVDGESMVDRLKRQVEYDRKSITTLYKELEEERNASAIAANQALAMITRLQEEKSTLQTEALQYLRMMEEQAEYDVDALQKANELLAEKEKEIQVLEAELEIYKAKLPLEAAMEDTQEAIHDSERSNKKMDQLDVSRTGYNISTPCNTPREVFEERKQPRKTYMMNGSSSTQESLVGFEDERTYISQCLKTLEKKLHLFSNNGVHFSNGRYSEKEENGVNYLRELHYEDMIPGSYQHEVDKNSSTQGNCPSLPFDSHYDVNQKYNSDCEGKDHDNHLVSLEHEISYLNERLEALEADRNFLEHTMNSLQTDDGILFIQEIAHDLRELRKVGIRREEVLQ